MEKSLLLLFLLFICSQTRQLGKSCTDDCDGLADGKYQSCHGCNFYLVCRDGGATRIRCNESEIWSRETGDCVKDNGACSVGSENCRANSDNCSQTENEYFHSCQGCNYFVQCSNGKFRNIACNEEHLVYNDEAKVCTPPDYWMPPRCNLASDLDECDDGSNTCSIYATCINTVGSYICMCNEGFTGDGFNCSDIDECTDDIHGCSPNATCTNNDGSYTCQCSNGFSGDGFSCIDINECTNDIHGCSTNATCINNDGSYTCQCFNGFSGDGFSCIDIDECTDDIHGCSPNATCTNNHGSYTCQCSNGFSGDGFSCIDINECTNDIHGCSTNATCTNNDGSYTCQCFNGFSGDGFSCIDINECTSDIHGCSPNATCTNNDGSYTCQCFNGFSGDGSSCIDINECTKDIHGCSPNATCTNNDGSYTCQCLNGFSGDGFSCIDINECTNIHRCSPNGMCTNNDGSYTCQCLNGFSGDGVSCIDINECTSDIHGCSPDATCTNNDGSYTCLCLNGFSGEGVSCIDINECTNDIHQCSPNATCTNNDGSYTCQCFNGFSGDGSSCIDINECTKDIHQCSPHATCTNNDGSYTCQCFNGFSGDGVNCIDINECAQDIHGCSPHATCTNNDGSYTCQCDNGFSGDGVNCIDINECAQDIHGCSPHATCTNGDGSYTCQCLAGFSGDGFSCFNITDSAESRTIFIVSLRFAKLEWQEDYLNVSSEAFLMLKIRLSQNCKRVFGHMEGFLGIGMKKCSHGSVIADIETLFGRQSKGISVEDIASIVNQSMDDTNSLWESALGIDPSRIIVYKIPNTAIQVDESKYSPGTLLMIIVLIVGTVILCCVAFMLVTFYRHGSTRGINDPRHAPRNSNRRFWPSFAPWGIPPPYPYPDRPPPYPGDSPQDSQWSWLDQGGWPPPFHARVAASVPGPNNTAPQAPATYIDVVSSGQPQHPGFDPVLPPSFPNQNDSEGTTTASPVYVDNIDLFSDPLSGVDQQPPTVDQMVEAWACNAQDTDSRPSTNSDTYEALQQHQWNPAIPRPMDRGKILDRVKDGLQSLFGTISSRRNVPTRQQINNTRGAATGISRGANNFEMEEIPSGEITYATSLPQPQPGPQLKSHKSRLPRHHFGPESTRHNMNYISPDPKRRYNGLLRHPGCPRGRINGPSGFNSRHITPMARLRVSAEISFNRNFRPYHRPR